MHIETCLFSLKDVKKGNFLKYKSHSGDQKPSDIRFLKLVAFISCFLTEEKKSQMNTMETC